MKETWTDKLTDEDLTQLIHYPQEIVPDILKTRIMENVRAKKEQQDKNQFRRPNFVRFLSVAAGLVVIFISLFYLMQRVTIKDFKAPIVYLNGQVVLQREGEEINLNPEALIIQKDALLCDLKGEAAVNLGGQYLVTAYGQSQVKFLKLSSEKALLNLEKGALMSKLLNKSLINYEVTTPQARFISMGASFYVSCGQQGSYIHVKEGQVRIISLNSDVKQILSQGQSLLISSEGELGLAYSDRELTDDYKQQDRLSKNLMAPETGRLILELEPQEVLISIMDIKIEIHDKLSILLTPGEYDLKFDKSGYETLHQNIKIESDKNKILKLELKPVKIPIDWKGLKLNSMLIPSEKSWQWEKVYQYSNKYNEAYNNILGFALSPDYAVAITQTELICLDPAGKIQWVNSYGAENEILFKALPVIYKDLVLASSFDKLVMVELKTGQERTVPAPGILLEGQKPLIMEDKVLFAFAAGVYVFEPQEQRFRSKPLIAFENATTPLFYENRIYAASALAPEIAVFSQTGQKINKLSLASYCYSSPLVMGDKLYVSDQTSRLYQLTLDLAIICSFNLAGRLYHLIPGSNDLLYTLSDNGRLYAVNARDNSLLWQKKVDKAVNTHMGIYAYKEPLAVNQEVLTVSDQGELLSYKQIDGRKTLLGKISKTAASCGLYPYYNYCLTGTSSGEIIKLGYN